MIKSMIPTCFALRRLTLVIFVFFFPALLVVAHGADVDLQFANLHNPYFSDRAPSELADSRKTYVLAPVPPRFWGIEGDVVSVPFTVVSKTSQPATISVRLFYGQTELASTNSLGRTALHLFRARDNYVEGNSNANCSCPAGELPQTTTARNVCVIAGGASENLTPKGCPDESERLKIANSLVRVAPFTIKDALEQVENPKLSQDLAAGTELFVADLSILSEFPKADLEVLVTVQPLGGKIKTISIPLRVVSLKLDNFPVLDLSYWSSEDPRDLVERPSGTPLNAHWGGGWWSEEHWANIERLANLQARLGVTNSLVPLFIKNPFGISSVPLIPVRCITGLESASARGGGGGGMYSEVASWHYEFDFKNFRRWISVFKKAGFRKFEGAHLFANSGEIPNFLECDLYHTGADVAPYSRSFRFLPRSNSASDQKDLRLSIYKEKFLPTFLRKLAEELRSVGLENSYMQHVIDENASSEAAISAYAAGAATIRENLPGIKTIDAINKYTATRYRSLVDLPVIHLLLIYDDQGSRAGIRKEIEDSFPGGKYFYNTALRKGGPNRLVDTNPLESRVYGWLALESGYSGILYWASNSYRYPTAKEFSGTKRPEDWSPYRYSQGPLPGGYVEPGYGAGGNWILYPTRSGLTDSLRARRLRDGLLDHWIYMKAWVKCNSVADNSCHEQLLALRNNITGDNMTIGDFSRNPVVYDEARETMLVILNR